MSVWQVVAGLVVFLGLTAEGIWGIGLIRLRNGNAQGGAGISVKTKEKREDVESD